MGARKIRKWKIIREDVHTELIQTCVGRREDS
jgi:hypothetical protein